MGEEVGGEEEGAGGEGHEEGEVGGEVGENGQAAAENVRERGGITVPMHRCTHAHVCTPTHSVPPIPSSASPRVTHACTHAHPNCHVPVRPLRRSRPLPRLLCLLPTRAPVHSRTLTHVRTVQPTASPASPCPRDTHPPRPAQTCSHPRHALSLDKYVQAP